MKLINALIVSAAALTLGACAITIDGEEHGDYSHHGGDHMTVTLPNGERDSFSCPEGTDGFVVDKTNEGKGMVYGCRTQGAQMPVLED